MHNYDKAKILEKRHIKIAIEWGGTDLFTNISNMSNDGVVEFLRIMSLNDPAMIDGLLTALIQEEYGKQN